MFDRLSWQLFRSYLGVFTIILSVFAIAVRLVFGYSLRQSLSQELIILAKVAATHAEIKDDRLVVSDEFTGSNVSLPDREFEWFDRQKNLVNKFGHINLNLPLKVDSIVQFQKYPGQKPDETISVIVPVISNDNQQQIGYVRITQSLDALDRTLHQLDIGLISGMVISLTVSSGAGIWLTRKAIKPTLKSYQRLQQFTADAAHELRSPLMAVKTNASTALKYSDGMRTGDLKKFQAIASATNQIITLAEDLLILARAEDDRNLATEQINLNLVLAEIVARYQSQIDAKSLILEVAIQPNLWLQGSTNHLDRALVNLLENAIHYTPVAGKIRILASRVERQIEIAIIDTGVGIAASDLERIFDRFWREDRSRTQWVGGSGLGLSIARSIVKQHHGSIEVQSELGKGSKFIVRLFSD